MKKLSKEQQSLVDEYTPWLINALRNRVQDIKLPSRFYEKPRYLGCDGDSPWNMDIYQAMANNVSREYPEVKINQIGWNREFLNEFPNPREPQRSKAVALPGKFTPIGTKLVILAFAMPWLLCFAIIAVGWLMELFK